MAPSHKKNLAPENMDNQSISDKDSLYESKNEEDEAETSVDIDSSEIITDSDQEYEFENEEEEADKIDIDGPEIRIDSAQEEAGNLLKYFEAQKNELIKNEYEYYCAEASALIDYCYDNLKLTESKDDGETKKIHKNIHNKKIDQALDDLFEKFRLRMQDMLRRPYLLEETKNYFSSAIEDPKGLSKIKEIFEFEYFYFAEQVKKYYQGKDGKLSFPEYAPLSSHPETKASSTIDSLDEKKESKEPPLAEEKENNPKSVRKEKALNKLREKDLEDSKKNTSSKYKIALGALAVVAGVIGCLGIFTIFIGAPLLIAGTALCYNGAKQLADTTLSYDVSTEMRSPLKRRPHETNKTSSYLKEERKLVEQAFKNLTNKGEIKTTLSTVEILRKKGRSTLRPEQKETVSKIEEEMTALHKQNKVARLSQYIDKIVIHKLYPQKDFKPEEKEKTFNKLALDEQLRFLIYLEHKLHDTRLSDAEKLAHLSPFIKFPEEIEKDNKEEKSIKEEREKLKKIKPEELNNAQREKLKELTRKLEKLARKRLAFLHSKFPKKSPVAHHPQETDEDLSARHKTLLSFLHKGEIRKETIEKGRAELQETSTNRIKRQR